MIAAMIAAMMDGGWDGSCMVDGIDGVGWILDDGGDVGRGQVDGDRS